MINLNREETKFSHNHLNKCKFALRTKILDNSWPLFAFEAIIQSKGHLTNFLFFSSFSLSPLTQIKGQWGREKKVRLMTQPRTLLQL